MPPETAAVVARFVYTIQPCTSLHCHFIRSHLRRMHVCLTVTCHLHFWQNDQYLRCVCVLGQHCHTRPSLKRRCCASNHDLNPSLSETTKQQKGWGRGRGGGGGVREQKGEEECNNFRWASHLQQGTTVTETRTSAVYHRRRSS